MDAARIGAVMRTTGGDGRAGLVRITRKRYTGRCQRGAKGLGMTDKVLIAWIFVWSVALGAFLHGFIGAAIRDAKARRRAEIEATCRAIICLRVPVESLGRES